MAGIFGFSTEATESIPYGAGWASTAPCYDVNGSEVFEHHLPSHPFPIKHARGKNKLTNCCVGRHGVNEVKECIVVILWARLDEAVRMASS